jgi:hypothetical protein
MEGIIPAAASARLAEYKQAHPEVDIDCIEGNHYAWKPVPGDEFAGEFSHGRTEEELLAKLGG